MKSEISQVWNFARHRNSGEFWKRLATDILVWRFGEFHAIFWKHLALNFLVWRIVWPVYCTYLLTYSYVGLLFLSLLMVWKLMTLN